MIAMVKCPICEMDVSPEEYPSHFDAHQREVSGMKSTVPVRSGLERMRRWASARDFESLLKEGMEVLLDLGAYNPRRGSVYNGIAISILSGYKDRWDDARNALARAIEDLG